MQDTKLVRTCIDADPHTLVMRRQCDASSLDLLFDALSVDDPTDALAVTYEGPEELLETWRERIDRRPRNVGVVSVGEQMRSATATTPTDRNVVRGVPDPEDAEAIRSAVTGYLDAWPADGHTVAYFDSVTEFLDHWDAGTGVEFLRRLLRSLDARDTVGYFCLTPAVHDRATVREVASLFDTVVECVESTTEAVSEPSVSDCFEAVSDPRRRYVLAELTGHESTGIAEIADSVAARTSLDRQQVTASLKHVHLPKLADFGMVAYDRERERIAPGEYFERVEPYFRKAVGGDATPQTE
ncbi:helix-turn-helix transcriptional regulator [Halorussus sp. MSC15.2]|uniref:helix-turn-helix transcriptional regulator n=1 Tax=Halorussus sp. MSC15.2 TaxID=2283638 RepID=UPI0013D24096|nr:helix-turn-helix transcriptional regulator [Halorussus sp. MSC15.2]NEU56440.1 helix-turn-helix transcriptional regulator [Halorussus sp. MSC15.2]